MQKAGVCNTPLRKLKTECWAYAIRPYETETTHEAGVEAKLVLTMPCKKEFFYEVKKTEHTIVFKNKKMCLFTK